MKVLEPVFSIRKTHLILNLPLHPRVSSRNMLCLLYSLLGQLIPLYTYYSHEFSTSESCLERGCYTMPSQLFLAPISRHLRSSLFGLKAVQDHHPPHGCNHRPGWCAGRRRSPTTEVTQNARTHGRKKDEVDHGTWTSGQMLQASSDALYGIKWLLITLKVKQN